MFTGIIQKIGKVVKSDGRRLWIGVPFSAVKLGESVAVNGVCLTVAAKKRGSLAFDVGKVTARITTLASLKAGEPVNLERSLRVGDRLGGHWVSGHVEKTARITKITKGRHSWLFQFEIPKSLRKYIVPRGSVAVDGISLTITAVRKNKAEIMIIPHTLTHTTLSKKIIGARVNLEPDILAKYVVGRHPRRPLAGDL